jgi:hypothetical protein
VRRYNDYVFEAGSPRDGTFTVEDVEAVINEDLFQRGRYYFEGVWNQAGQGAAGQQAIIQVLAPHPEGLSQEALRAKVNMSEENFQKALATLENHDVIEKTASGWRIPVELFRRWAMLKSKN